MLKNFKPLDERSFCMKNQGLYNKWLTITGNYSTQLYNSCLEGDCL